MSEKNLVINKQAKVQEIQVSREFAKIPCPSRMLVTGPTMAGKSQFALNLVKFRSQLYTANFEKILYALPGESIHLYQSFIQELRNVFADIRIIEGIPDVEEHHLTADKNHKLLILDDLMVQAFASKGMLDLITKGSHHANISVILISQSIFLPAKNRLTLARNCSEKVIFHDKGDVNQLSFLSRMIYPGNSNFLSECFNYVYSATLKKDLKYLFIDSSPLSEVPHNCIVRTFIFPREDGKIRPVFFFPS